MRLKPLCIRSICLLGPRATFLTDDRSGFYDTADETEQERKIGRVLARLDLDIMDKILIRTEDDLLHLDTAVDVFLVFVHTMHKFATLRRLAETGIPLILTGEEGAPGDALDAYESIADFPNVAVIFDYSDVKRKLRNIQAVRYVRNAKICVFDRGERLLEAAAWHRNPLLDGSLRTEYVGMARFKSLYAAVDPPRAEQLARQWMHESRVEEPSLKDVTASARLYLAMKQIIDDMEGDAGYVLWCGQFSGIIEGKMCFSIARLNDAGYLVGCWRGENMLPMLVLHALSDGPVFFGEMHTFREGVISLRHCAVPSTMASAPPVLKRWRNREGTVTGYCEMPTGEVTIVNTGIGDKIVAVTGEVIETRDLGGNNCRTTVYIRLHEERLVRRFRGREAAMVYGNYVDEIMEAGRWLDLPVN